MQCISPGLTDTKMFEDSGMLELINKAKQRARILDPTDVADALVYVLSTPRHVHVSFYNYLYVIVYIIYFIFRFKTLSFDQ